MVKRLRETRGLTQQELARKAGISQAYLSRIESGEKKNPGIRIAQRLARALGVGVEELLR